MQAATTIRASASAERAAEFEAILTLLRGRAEDRDAAEWASVRKVVEGLAALQPREMSYPEMLRGVTLDELRAALAQPADERPPYAALFTAFRAEVWRLEEHNRARLSVLAAALGRIAQLRARGFDPAALARFESAIRRHLRAVWQLEPPGEGDDPREWPTLKTRAYELLPKAWRAL